MSNVFLGKTFNWAKSVDVNLSVAVAQVKYHAGWADKITGQTLEVCLLVADFL
jgi:aldehyde dehydrogenase (NAD+)